MEEAPISAISLEGQTPHALNRRAALIAAATAAASWAHARRSTWAVAPAVAAPARVDTTLPSLSLAPLVRMGRLALNAALSTVDGARLAADALCYALGAAATAARPLGPPLVRWLPRVAAFALLAAALTAAGLSGRVYFDRWKTAVAAGIAADRPVDRVADDRVARADRVNTGSKRTGRLVVTSTTTVARVLVDGTFRGMTPLTLDALGAGDHVVLLESAEGTVQRTVTVAPRQTAQVEETIFPGWLTIIAPVDLSISEAGRAIRLDDRSQVMLPPGPHDLVLENRALGYHELRRVDVRPGEMTRLSIAPLRSTMTVTAAAASEVWLDGVSVGQTPLVDLPVELGTHDVRLKSAAGEREITATVTVKPLALNVDFPAAPAPAGAP